MPQNEQSTTEHVLNVDTFNGGRSDPFKVPAGEPHRFIIKRGPLLTVKIVDETGAPVEGVSLIFRGAGTSETVPTNGDGVAKCATITAESVEVAFASAEDVNKTMNAVWESRDATPEADYLQSSDEITPVVARPSIIEVPDGKEFISLSVKAGQTKTISVRPAKRRAILIEIDGTLFRTNSAVVMPEGEAPAATVGEHESLTTVGLIATILRYNEEHEGKKLFIAGHADKAGTEDFNKPLSEERANAVLALLEGDRNAYVNLCTARNSEVDVTQLFDWTHNNPSFSFECKPTTLIAAPSDENYYLFRKSYNRWVDGATAAGETRGTKIGEYGRLQPDIWEAMFNLYEYGLREELGEDDAGVTALRGKLQWVDDTKKTIGFGESHPVDENRPDGMRSQVDRRTETLLFDAGEEPDLAATNGEDVYDGVTYEKKPIEPMMSAKRWTAKWEVKTDPATGEEMPAKMGERRTMTLTAPAIAIGEPLVFKVYQVLDSGDERVTDTRNASAVADGASIPFYRWYNPDLVQNAGSEPLPNVKFRFEVQASSRSVRSGMLPYGDTLEFRVLYGQSSDWTPPEQQNYCIHSPWGQRSGQSIEWNGENGWIREFDLPPGGISLVLGERYLVGENI
jgi:outer membrane protein OmpA-like peptidoglycan-associated protein